AGHPTRLSSTTPSRSVQLRAVRRRAGTRDHTLELPIPGEEIDAHADEPEWPSARAVDDRIPHQLHDLSPSVDERGITGRIELRASDLNGTRAVDQAIAVHADRVGNDLNWRLRLSRRVALDDRHCRAADGERLGA